MLIGLTEVIPGVSGGTVALLIGLYERLIEAINGITTKEWKKHALFLINVGIGMGVAILVAARAIGWLIANQPYPTFYFIMGLVIAIIPTLLRDVNYRKEFHVKHYLLFTIAVVLVALTALAGEDKGAIIVDFTWQTYAFLFLSGWLASTALILPGISGSLIFLILGVYATIIQAVSDFNLPILFAVGFGVLIGLVITSKIVRYFFYYHRSLTYAVMIGAVSGSIFVIFPGIPVGFEIFICIISLILGFLVAYQLGKIKKEPVEN
ncbi:membrane protein [Alkalihalobacillus pseudalcaliphilus]|nr:membrane protein [Alkalihalobacillus pseudalcaliphilus]